MDKSGVCKTSNDHLKFIFLNYVNTNEKVPPSKNDCKQFMSVCPFICLYVFRKKDRLIDEQTNTETDR